MTVVVQDLIELAERCEKATGKDRRLDGLIFKLLTQREEDMWTTFGDDDIWHRRDPQDHVAFDPPPHYTGSIDAAMTLIPDGFLWKCGYSRHVPHQADLTDYKNHTGRYDGNSDHSRALALCAAALRARASIKGEG